MFPWNPSPLRPSKFPFEYLLLPPRSAPAAAPPGVTPELRRTPRRPSYSFRPGSSCREDSRCRNGPVWVRRSSAIHFQGRSIRQVSCYTLLGGFRLPWPPPCCLYRPTPFVGSDERQRWAPQPGVRFIPQRQFCLPKVAHSAPGFRTRPRGSGGPGFSPVESLRIGRGRFVPEASNHSLYRMKLRMYLAPAILRETSEGTSY